MLAVIKQQEMREAVVVVEQARLEETILPRVLVEMVGRGLLGQ
jgi:hypothetical protein